MRVREIERHAIGERGSRVTAIVDGHPLWFASHDARLTASGEAFGSALLIPALARRESLEIDAPTDPVWLASVPRIAAKAGEWWGYRSIRISAPPAPDGRSEAVRGVIQCFTGGVDSYHCLLQSAEPRSALLFVHGFDIPRGDRRRLEAFLPGFRETARAVGAAPVLVTTNLREHPSTRGASWGRAHGGALAAVGHLLALERSKLVIPPSYPYYDSKPWGSHWDLDPHWSSSRLAVEHGDASMRRYAKLRQIGGHPLVRRYLRVCWENRAATGNCSSCEKCVRTMLALEMSGELARSEAFDAAEPLSRRLDSLRPVRPNLVSIYEDLLRDIRDEQLTAAVRRLLRRSRRSWRWLLGWN